MDVASRTALANADAHASLCAIDARRREQFATVIDRHSFGSTSALLNPLRIARVCRVAGRDRSPSLSRIQRGNGPIAIADAFDVACEDAANAVASMGVRTLRGQNRNGPGPWDMAHMGRFRRADAFMQQLIHLSDAGAIAIEWPDAETSRATMHIERFYEVATPIVLEGQKQAVIANRAEPFTLRPRTLRLPPSVSHVISIAPLSVRPSGLRTEQRALAHRSPERIGISL